MLHRIAFILTGILLFCSTALFSAGTSPVLFLKTYYNYAWGYTHCGFFIDSAGTVFTYTFSEEDSVPYLLRNDTVPEIVLTRLFEKGTPTGKTVPADSLQLMYGFADGAAAGMLTTGYGCEDFGVCRYSMLLYDPTVGGMKEVICFQQGDETVCNTSPEAKTVARWMLTAIDSADLSNSLSCSPDSCLFAATPIVPPLPVQPAADGKRSPGMRFQLNGKKGSAAAQRLTVGREGKMPFSFTPAAKKQVFQQVGGKRE
ncbi:MAG: hypothetical protein JW863_00765 [Chitinispirillaceae bacterium]|nr:hypothetical protein [Chitinispirillaceae bacterium]